MAIFQIFPFISYILLIAVANLVVSNPTNLGRPCPGFSVCVPPQECSQDKIAKSHMVPSSHPDGHFQCDLNQLAGRGQGICCFLNQNTPSEPIPPENLPEFMSTEIIVPEEAVARQARQQQSAQGSDTWLAIEDLHSRVSNEEEDFALEERSARSYDEAVITPNQIFEPDTLDPRLLPFSSRASGADDDYYKYSKGDKSQDYSKKYDSTSKYSKYDKKASKYDNKYGGGAGAGDSYKNYQEYQDAMSMNKYGSNKYYGASDSKYSKYDDDDDDEYYENKKYHTMDSYNDNYKKGDTYSSSSHYSKYNKDDTDYYKKGSDSKYEDQKKYSGSSYSKEKYYGSTVEMEQDPWTPFILGCVNECVYKKNAELYYRNSYYQGGGGYNSNNNYGYGYNNMNNGYNNNNYNYNRMY